MRCPAGPVQVVERVGYDIAPVDPTTPDGELLLTSYVWPDQLERLARLRGALAVARAVPAAVHRASAGTAVRGLGTADGTLTVLWHSVMWQYLSGAEQEEVRAGVATVAATATARAPFAHLRMEPVRVGRDHEFRVLLDTWPDRRQRRLGVAAPHGLPTRWDPG